MKKISQIKKKASIVDTFLDQVRSLTGGKLEREIPNAELDDVLENLYVLADSYTHHPDYVVSVLFDPKAQSVIIPHPEDVIDDDTPLPKVLSGLTQKVLIELSGFGYGKY